jgi:hypothetical protein
VSIASARTSRSPGHRSDYTPDFPGTSRSRSPIKRSQVAEVRRPARSGVVDREPVAESSPVSLRNAAHGTGVAAHVFETSAIRTTNAAESAVPVVCCDGDTRAVRPPSGRDASKKQ